MTAIGAVIDILSVVSNTAIQEFLLINQLNNFFHFDHNVFLLDSSIDVNRLIRIREDKESTPQSIFILQSADNFTKLASVKEMRTKNTFLIFAPESVSFERNLNSFSQLKKIQKLQIQMKIGVFFSHIALKEDIQKLFKWCWKNRIINIFATTPSYPEKTDGSTTEALLNILTFNPFGTFEIINVTGSWTFDKFFLSQKSNFQQHVFLVGEGQIQKRSEKLWEAVLHVINASIIIDNRTNKVSSAPLNSSIDFLLTSFISSPASTRKINLYPVQMNSMVLLVPEALPYSEFTSYLQAITSASLFGYSLITIAVVILLLTTVRYINQERILFLESGADVLNLLLNDNGYIRYRNLSLTEILLIVPLTFMGFVIVNGVFSTLQSYLTRPFLQPQIKTVEDIYQSQLVILTQMEAYKTTIAGVLTDLSAHGDWNNRMLIITNKSIVDERRVSYDTSVIHLVQLDFADRIISFQKRLNIKGYYRLKQNIITTISLYIAHPEFQFCERFNEIIHWIQSAGLIDRWMQLDRSEAEANLVQSQLKRLENTEEIDIERFSFPIFIVYGWIAGIIVFLIEIIWNIYIKKFYKNIV